MGIMFYSGKIIDCHCHPFVSEDQSIAHYGFPFTADDFFAEMHRNGYAACCGSVILLRRDHTSFEDIRRVNRIELDLRERYGSFYIPGIQVHGDYPEESCREIEEMYHQHGVRWIGELVAHSLGTGAYDSPGMFAIYETAVKLGVPVNIHCADLAVVENVVKNFPRLNVVLAHPDDAASFLERSGLVSRYKNLFLDISGTGLFRWGMLKYCVKLMGPEKILFGTDFPICNPAMYIAGVLAENLSPEENHLIFAGNFLRLTGMTL